MQHIERSAFRKGEYTALAGTAQTLTRYRIFRRDTIWVGIPLIQCTLTRDPAKPCVECDTLRDMDAVFISISGEA